MAQNIFNNLPSAIKSEHFTELLNTAGIKIETIISEGHVTPKNTWYDQQHDEWVLVLKGAARIKIKGCPKEVVLNIGDHLHLPAHTKHRVCWTHKSEQTLWLAIHFPPPSDT